MQATGLVSEFFVHVARTAAFTTRTKAQFLIVASCAMRRLLVDYARARRTEKRGGRLVRVDIDHADAGAETNYEDLIAIDDLLGQLAASDARMAQIVEMRFFGGLTNARDRRDPRRQRPDGEAGLADGSCLALQPAAAGRRT